MSTRPTPQQPPAYSDGPDTIWIESTRLHGEQPTCLLTWRHQRWTAPAADVRETAMDLLTCATYAELLMQLSRLHLDARTITGFVSELLTRNQGGGKPFMGCKSTLTMLPVGSSKSGQAWVGLKRGSLGGEVDPAQAREMAVGWLEAAEASKVDHDIAEALSVVGHKDAAWTESFFRYLSALRHT